MAQKATGREVIGTVCKMSNGKLYELTEIDVEKEVLTFTEQLDEDSKATPDVVKVTKDNAAVAHYKKNPNDKPAPEGKFENGVLTVNGKEVKTGTLPVVGVIGGVIGNVLVAMKAKSGADNRIDIFAYDVQFDKFSVLVEDYAADTKLFVLDGMNGVEYILLSNIIVEKEIKDEDDKVIGTGKFLDKVVVQFVTTHSQPAGTSEVRLTNVGCSSCGCDCPCDDCSEYDECGGEDYDCDDYADWENDDCSTGSAGSFGGYNVPVDSIRMVKHGGAADYVVVSTHKLGEHGELVKAEPMIKLFKDRTCDGKSVGTFMVKNAAAKVYLGGIDNPPVVTVKSSKDFLFRNKRGLVVVDDASVISAMADYNVFCGITADKDDDDNDVITFTFAKDDLSEVKSFTMTKSDRGNLFAIA